MNQEKFHQVVKTFNPNLNIHYLLIKQDENSYCHAFNNRQKPSDIRSISKTVLTLVAGILMDLSAQGKYPHFDQDTLVFPLLEDAITLTNFANKPMLEKTKIKHLLTHTIGYDKVLLMRDDIADLDPFTYLDHVINTPIKYEPGDYYLYSNAGFYLLSAVLQEFLKEDLLDFIDRYLFKPLEITSYDWEKYGHYLAGATRLKMYPEDLVKIGQVLMNQGVYGRSKIVNPQFIEKMLRPTTYTSNIDKPNAIFRRYAYASGIWLAKEPIFFGHGTDGQRLVMIPEKNTIIVILAHEGDTDTIEKIVNDIIIGL